MRTLTDVYDTMASKDVELEKQASEIIKQAEEEDAAGRITARAFADELSKLAEVSEYKPTKPAAGGFASGAANRQGGTIPSGGFGTSGGGAATGAGFGAGQAKRKQPRPPVKDAGAAGSGMASNSAPKPFVPSGKAPF